MRFDHCAKCKEHNTAAAAHLSSWSGMLLKRTDLCPPDGHFPMKHRGNVELKEQIGKPPLRTRRGSPRFVQGRAVMARLSPESGDR
jgi:hypothetical protein